MAASIQRHAAGISTFVSHVNPITGKMDWIVQDEHYDFHQEIARSAYADMLHDRERNEKYYRALQKVITKLKSQGQRVDVLDIGTGTGLLSMMAATAGADTVTACEAFRPMAECARRILQKNKLSEKIRLVPKRSTEMTVGPDGDLPQRANVLVTEVFDTELIGEGAIATFNHAHRCLLQTDCAVIPHSANVYAQPVCSDLIRRWNQISSSDTCTAIPPEVGKCGGAPSLHDLQLDQLHSHFTPLAAPQPVFRFEFGSKEPIAKTRRTHATVEASSEGRVDAVFMWWDCQMDREGEITLSCAPRWAHPDDLALPWRDHWMQAVYYPNTQLRVQKGAPFTIVSCHDEFSLWFDVCSLKDRVEVSENPVCTCGYHSILSRSRIAMLGDPTRIDVLQQVVKKHVHQSSVCLVVTDGSLLPVMAAQQASKVYVLETPGLHRRVTESLIRENDLGHKVILLDKEPDSLTLSDLNNDQIDVVLGEPYFVSSHLPWHNIHLWYATAALRPLMHPDTPVFPSRVGVWAVAMQFDHLWKIRAPVGNCEGFDLTEFDQLIESSAGISDSNVEPQPLWEYPGAAMSQPAEILQLQSDSIRDPLQSTVNIQIQRAGPVNGVAIWTEFYFGDGLSLSGGPQRPVMLGERPLWDKCTRQGLHLLATPVTLNPGDGIGVTVHFLPQTGEFDFSFSVKT